MLLPSAKDHFQFGRQADDEETFLVQCGDLSRAVQSPLAEAKLAAQNIYELSSVKKLKLCLSGGIDSECMLESFLQQGIPFEAVFLRFKNELNLFDIKTNLDLCESLNIKYSVIDLDIIQFLESGRYLEIAEKYECQSPQLATHLWMLDQIDGIPILGGNPILPTWQNQHLFFIGLPGELHSTYFKYFMINQREGVPWFFIYSPELISSFFHLDCSRPYLENKRGPADYTYLEKCKGYAQGGFKALPRLDKFTGFELVRNYYDEKYQTKNGITFNEKFRLPLEKMFPFPERYVQLVPQSYFPAK